MIKGLEMQLKLAPFVNVLAVVTDRNELSIEHVSPVIAAPEQHRSEATHAGASAVIEMLGRDGTVLLRDVLVLQRFCLHPVPWAQVDRPEEGRVFAGIIAVPPDAALLQVTSTLEEVEVALKAERVVPAEGPIVRFDWDPGNSLLSARQTISWDATHPQGTNMLHTLFVRQEDGTRIPISLPGPKPVAEVDFDALPGGLVALEVEATDGFHVTRVESPAFKRPLSATVATIVSPLDDEQLLEGQPIVLRGHGYYRETGTWERRWLFWSSDVQGDLGPGSPAAIQLQPGKHRITLRAGVPGREGHAEVTITIEPNADGKD